MADRDGLRRLAYAPVPAGDYIEGLFLFGAMLSGTVGGAWLIARRRFGHLSGAVRVVAIGLLTTLGILAVHVAPAALGVLTRGTVLAATVLWVGVAAATPAVRRGPSAPRRLPADGAMMSIPAVICLIGVATFVLAFFADQATVPPTGIDVLSFHLPGVARWIETGSIWQVDNLLPYAALGNYPNNGDVILLAAVIPWHNDFLSHLSIYPFFVLTGAATYTFARELGAVRSTAAIAATTLLAIPVVAAPALVLSLVDCVMLFGLAAGLTFLLRHHRTGERSDLVLAGLALGVSFGTKWYAVSAVAVVVFVWAIATLLSGRGLRPVIRQGLTLTALIGLAGGIWFVRNLIESGNPFFPVKLAPLGVTIFDAPFDLLRELGGFTIVDYIGDWHVWGAYILPQLRQSLASPGILAVAGLLASGGVLLVRRRRAGPRPGLWLAAALCAALLAATYSVTPYTAGGVQGMPSLVGADSRYVVPAAMVALALGAAVVSRFGDRLRLVAEVAGILALVDGLVWASNGQLTSGRLGLKGWLIGAFLLVALAALGSGLKAWRQRVRGGSRAVPIALAAFAVAGLVGYGVQDRFNDDRYTGVDPVLDYVLAQAPAGHAIGLAGYWDDAGIAPILPSFGPRLENRVAFVGRTVQGKTLRPYRGRVDFADALRRGGYDLLIVGRGRPGVPEGEEAAWARSAGFTKVAASQRFILLRRS